MEVAPCLAVELRALLDHRKRAELLGERRAVITVRAEEGADEREVLAKIGARVPESALCRNGCLASPRPQHLDTAIELQRAVDIETVDVNLEGVLDLPLR